MIKRFKNFKLLFFLLLFTQTIAEKNFAQVTGSLFMMPDNFYAQMYSPSYMRADGATEISFVGFGGFSFVNQGNFKISHLITTPEGNPVVDFENFYRHIKPTGFIRQDFSLPLVFVSIPRKKGTFSFFYKENFSSFLNFKKEVIDFLIHGNFEENYHNFSSEAINVLLVGYREFSFGYAKKQNKKLDIGAHAKLLFGTALLRADNWDYKIETSPEGRNINFLSGGKGNLMLPFPVKLRADKTIHSVDIKNAPVKYLTAYQNPGFAIDLGMTYYFNAYQRISASVRDVGGIWYNHNAMKLNHDFNYGFIGFDMVNAVRYPEDETITPLELTELLKDSIRMLWQPKVDEINFISGLSPKTVLHYQHSISEKHSFGITNQSAFQKNYFLNVLTLTAMQKWPNLSVFESLNVHGVSDISLGAGIQYEGKSIQAFLATDNIIAFYHPANNKTISITAGLCILLNHEKEVSTKINTGSIKKRGGRTSAERPFYKKLKGKPK